MSNTAIKYACVDDMPSESNALIEDLTETGLVDFEPINALVGNIDQQIKDIESSDANGILLDYVLKVRGGQGGPERVSNSLAQQMRDNATLAVGQDKPIVLWSSAKNFRDYYERDTTARDLYDLHIDKTKIPDTANDIANKLVALVRGYCAIRQHNHDDRAGLIQMLGLKEEEATDILDPRVGDPFLLGQSRPEHEYARYIIRELLSEPNPLVDRALLFARLGVDEEGSEAGDIEALLADIECCKYAGAFCSGWERWWWQRVWDWWANVAGQRDIQQLSAERRVSLLNEKHGWSLQAAEPIEKDYSTAYWTICEVYHRPLDPIDGFQASNSSVQPWHDARYLSAKAALGFEGSENGVEVHSIDRNRFQRLKKQHGATRS
ncbi:MAG: hypothetical protein JO193_08865 [Candidatus Eremiobacteraeota bacterium]|nr:hypothetical protein [Candidatus Eremiobacteraeota bacterium]MBV9972287.1 hypothetical protein [Candidatus Eremiobacteraeota bacterium]